MQSLCSQCGTINVPGATTCSSCGARLSNLEPTQRAAPGSMYGGYGQPNQSGAPYGPPYYQPAPPSYGAPPGQPMQPIYLASIQQPVVVVTPRKQTSAWKVIGILLLVLGIPLLLCGGPLAGFLYIIAHAPAVPTATVPPLYASDLTADDGNWQCQPGAQCQFEADGYHILAPDDHAYFSISKDLYFSEIIEVQASIAQSGSPNAGVAIGFLAFPPAGYNFIVFADGTYELLKYDGDGNIAARLVPRTATSAIHQGVNQQNALKVIADTHSAKITLFINGKQVSEVTDASYNNGNLALGSVATDTIAVFSHLTVTEP